MFTLETNLTIATLFFEWHAITNAIKAWQDFGSFLGKITSACPNNKCLGIFSFLVKPINVNPLSKLALNFSSICLVNGINSFP